MASRQRLARISFRRGQSSSGGGSAREDPGNQQTSGWMTLRRACPPQLQPFWSFPDLGHYNSIILILFTTRSHFVILSKKIYGPIPHSSYPTLSSEDLKGFWKSRKKYCEYLKGDEANTNVNQPCLKKRDASRENFRLPPAPTPALR